MKVRHSGVQCISDAQDHGCVPELHILSISNHTQPVPPRMGRNRGLLDAMQISFWLVGLLFAVKAVEILLQVSLDHYGIRPRDTHGLIGIIFSPLLHAGGAHLVANATPLFVLLTVLFWDRKYKPGSTIAIIWLVSGVGTWILGRGEFQGELTVHIGASSLIYGLVSYLIVAGFRMESWRAIFIAIVVFALYGGIFYGALPRDGLISWEGHLCGALAGAWTAFQQHRK